MTADDIYRTLDVTADRVCAVGLSDAARISAEFARIVSGSNLPIRLFCEWLKRTPEALSALLEEFNRIPTKISESASQDSAPPSFLATVTGDTGRKGASVDSVVVDVSNAASVLGRLHMTTRPVKPHDILDIGDVPGFRGQASILGDDGKVITALAKIGGRTFDVEFVDKRGPLIMMRTVPGDRVSSQVLSGDIKFVDPAKREEVWKALSALPGANDEFNFSPYESDLDPWLE